MNSELYDLIFLGISDAAGDPGQIVQKIAHVLRLDQARFEEAVRSRRRFVLRRKLPKDVGASYMALLSQFGVVCNLFPAAGPGETLSLATIEEDLPATAEFTCPACGHRETLAQGSDPPMLCPACGIVPDKYLKVQEQKAERESIRNRLLRQQQAGQAQHIAEATEQAERERRHKMEEEIRRELAMTPPSGAWKGQARTGLLGWGLGLLMGGVAVILHGRLTQPPAPLPPAAAGVQPAGAQGSPAAWQAPQVALGQSAALAEDGRPPIPRWDADHKDSPPGSVNTGQHPPLDWPVILAGSDSDPLWGRYVGRMFDRALADDPPGAARQLVDALPAGPERWRMQVRLASRYQQQGQSREADDLLRVMEAESRREPDPIRQVQDLALASEALNDMGFGERSAAMSAAITHLIQGWDNRKGKAAALGYQAAHWSRLGQLTHAHAAWHEANQILAGERDAYVRLTGYIQLAESYARAGDRATAIGLLSNTFAALSTVPAEAERRQVMEGIARGFCRAGDLDSALFVARDEVSGRTRENLVFELVKMNLSEADPYSALKTLEALETPLFRARTLALAAWSFKAEKQLDSMGQATLAQAGIWLSQIEETEAQAMAKADLARSTAWLGDAGDAEALSTQAGQSTALVGDGALKDQLWAYVARRQAQGNLSADARRSASFIRDTGLGRKLLGEIELAGLVFGGGRDGRIGP